MANPPSDDGFIWEDLTPDQVKEKDHVRVFNTRGRKRWIEGDVSGGTGGPFLSDPEDQEDQKWILLLRLNPDDRSVLLVTTDRAIQVRRPVSQQTQGNSTASDGFEANI